MTDSEYKVHMTMWAALRSPLIMGTDIRTLSPSDYSIYMNPAILAISQEPTGSTAQRIWRYYVPSTDTYGQGEIQLWAGQLSQGDYVVIFLNAANEDMYMNATLSDIFIGAGYAAGSQKNTNWDVYDLWANRMPDAVASQILMKNSTMSVMNSTQGYFYNATAQSYADGIQKNETALMGKHVGTWQAGGQWSTLVERHGVMAYRLRPQSSSGIRRKRDEL
jgi:alpha-galactosidase